MRVGLICPYDLSRYGGVQDQVLELARLLRANGDEATVIGPGAVDGVDLGSTLSVRANRSTVPVRLHPGVGKAISESVEGVDVVHLHEPLMPMVGWASLRVERPMVATFHADPPRWAHLLYRAIPDRVWRRRVLTAVSPVAASLPWPDVRVIPNGINLEFFRNGPERHRQRVVFVGRDDHRKGLEVLLAAWAEIHRALPSAELIAIGPDREDRDGVRYVGRGSHESKSAWLQSGAILVAPNLGGESFGLVVAEGMAAGCAIIASDLPAFQHVTGGTARLTPIEEHRPLAVALLDLLTNSAQADAMGKRARERAQAFGWNQVFLSYRQAYEDALRMFQFGR